MSTIESSITKFIKNLVSEKLVGQRFRTYRSSDGVSFTDDGDFRIDRVIDFTFTNVIDRELSGYNYDASIPSYTLRVSGIIISTNHPFDMCLSITDLP